MPLIMFDDDPGLGKGYLWNDALMKRGVYFHPWHNMFMCAAMTEKDIDDTLQASDEAFKIVRDAGAVPPVEKLAVLSKLTNAD